VAAHPRFDPSVAAPAHGEDAAIAQSGGPVQNRGSARRLPFVRPGSEHVPPNSSRTFTASSFHTSVVETVTVPDEQYTRFPVGAQQRIEFVTVAVAEVSR
jgi:hypothetical protein